MIRVSLMASLGVGLFLLLTFTLAYVVATDDTPSFPQRHVRSVTGDHIEHGGNRRWPPDDQHHRNHSWHSACDPDQRFYGIPEVKASSKRAGWRTGICVSSRDRSFGGTLISDRLLAPAEVRPDVCTALAAGCTDETRLKV